MIEKNRKYFTPRQMALLLASLSPLSKMVLAPSIISYSVGQSSYISVAILAFFELLTLGAILWTFSKTDLSIYELLEKAFSTIVAKVVLFSYGILLIIKSILFLSSQKLMMYNALYENISSFIYFIPVLLLIIYAGSKTPNTLARTIEILGFLILFSLFAIAFLSSTSFDYMNLFPILDNGTSNLMRSLYTSQLWFGDFLIFFLMYHRVRKTDRTGKNEKAVSKIFISGLVYALVVVGFFVIFIGVFGEIASKQTFAISKLSKYAVTFSDLGRFDFVFILTVFVGLILLSIFQFQASVSCFAFTHFKRWKISLVLGAILSVAVYYSSKNYSLFVAFGQTVMPIFAILLQFVLPILSPILVSIVQNKEKTNES